MKRKGEGRGKREGKGRNFVQSIHYSHAHNDNTESTTHVGYDQYADDTDGKNCFKWRTLSCPAGYASSAGLSPRVAPCQNLRGGPMPWHHWHHG